SADIIGSRGAAKEALAWAGRGGHLIVACSGTDRFRNDWRESDLFDFENNDKPVKDAAAPVFKELNVSFAETTPSKVTEVSFEDGEPATLECGNPAGLKLGRWHPDVLAGENDSAALASFSYKSGRVTLLATAEPFRNRYIDHADNASVLYELLQLHHSRSLLLILGGRTTLWGMLVEYAWMPLTATVLLVILWLWRHLPRFGRALPADQSSVRHFGTQLDEAGMFLSERAGHHALLAAARRAVHQAAAQRGVHEQGQGLAENLSARAGIPVAAVSEALNTSNDPGDPVAAAITLQKLQQSLGVTL
ncbi:MAG TPA: DUF4350 domain-containing protein, partial [Verrucomicrobiales bacterium]|nr:DUF4350 domain-containing protein [Verrucomicrobiales bacterium]